MKKVFYFILFISLFLVGSFVKADSDWSSCWTDPKYIDFETFYNRDNFHTMVYVCNEEKNPVPFNSACFESEDTARDLCKGTYHSNGAYKGNGSSYTTGKCSKQVVYNCWDCKYTCKYEDSYACQCGNYCDNDDDGEKDDYCCLNTCYEWKTQKFEKLVGAAASEKDTGGELKDEWVEESENACKGLSDRNYSFEGDCEQQYKVQFDTYTCNKYNYVEREVYNVMEAWYTTRGDSGDTINAYCINPDFEFSSKSSWKSIDATKCVSSNSTDDCGYANILIEGYYRYHDQSLQRQSAIIGAAMRLWGAYIDEGGYTQVGIADEDETTIGSDRLWLKFVEGPRGRYENMFENTVDAILNGTYVNDLYSVDSVKCFYRMF